MLGCIVLFFLVFIKLEYNQMTWILRLNKDYEIHQQKLMLNVHDNLQNRALFIICHQFTGGYGEKS